ncbi:MAG: GNAT family N-acetyltransferase [Dehalococcoidia bacterium]
MTQSTDTLQLDRFNRTVALKDGSVLHLRPIMPDDENRLMAFFLRLSGRTIYLRYHHVLTDLSREEAHQYSNIDYDNTFAVVGIQGEGDNESIIGVGRYWRLSQPNRAEIAFIVEDPHQRKGIGTHLLELLAAAAREHGIGVFEAEVLPENTDMIDVLQDSGFKQLEKITESHGWRGVYSIAQTPLVEQKSAEREKVASIASIRKFMFPRSIAVLGASNKPGIGNALVKDLIKNEYNGIIYPVNPKDEVVSSIKAYPSVLDIPGQVDMAIVAVAAERIQPLIEECGRKGVKSLVIITAGFSEMGGEGIERERKLLNTAGAYGMRIIGPNCLGIQNTNPTVNMNASFAPIYPLHGRTAFGSQSGALGGAIISYAIQINLGLSNFVSIGNGADVTGNELLQYWAEDPDTNLILLYLESFGNPRKFARIARETTLKKPVVIVKSGRSAVGARAAASHTGALASDDTATTALIKQTGMLRCNTLEELFDTALLLSNQPIPKGNRVAILTNGGGAGIMAADALAAHGFQLPILSDKARSALKSFLPPKSSYMNPIDTTAAVSPDQYRQALNVILQEDIDALIIIYIPPMEFMIELMRGVIREMAPSFRAKGIPVLANFLGLESRLVVGSKEEGYVPTYVFPESTAHALAKSYEYSERLKRPLGNIPSFTDINKAGAEKVIQDALARTDKHPVWLDTVEIVKLFSAYGIKFAQSGVAATAQQAAKMADGIGYPVALKLFSSTISHKTDVGGVILNLGSATEVKKAYAQIEQNLEKISRKSEMQGVTVQKMLTGGVELIVGVTEDKFFGPLIMFGLGGIYTELFKDVDFRIHPLTDYDAHEMLASFKAHKILDGWRGAPPSDTAAIEDVLLRVSALIEDIPEIQDLDLNPLIAMPVGEGCVVADARISVSPISV